MTAIDSMSKGAFMGYFAMDFEVAELFDSLRSSRRPLYRHMVGGLYVRPPSAPAAMSDTP